ncbi:hypothetical protein O9H85_18015 [Paenibacillus filicis]|uniref:Uncharacterized protein n=1 Tax=Paenibacillus gyeongsangnamensis TaxID=3388067 RepID=A0ABT4QBQ5_9BACL|nr:hypothetical protein [Paenibacillus filicis]MCZ8514291.1 hypothetical protein [Paenibacillus filicis]
MSITLAILKEKENSELLVGIKELLKESYHISEDEAILIIKKGIEKAEGLLFDYFSYVDSIQEISSRIRDTLNEHLKQVDQEEEMVLKMISEAAVWHAFERIRCYYKNMANVF